jgi:tRNA (guanine37-N1)-methyltransferase
LLEYPQYTRPPVFRDFEVPQILLSGNHGEIAKWRREQSLLRTAERRPELLDKVEMSSKEIKLVNEKRCKLSGEE